MGTSLVIDNNRPPRELVALVTQQTRFALVNNTLQPPEQFPSMYELNPSVTDATVYQHISKLINLGIAKEVSLDDDQRRQGYSWIFYVLTEGSQEFLEEHNLIAAEEMLQRICDIIADKAKKIVKYDNAPSPDHE